MANPWQSNDEQEQWEALKRRKENERAATEAKVRARAEQEAAYRRVENSIVTLEIERKALAELYAAQEDMSSVVEIELGNSIAKLRKAIEQLRKSARTLQQPALPMKD